jgi:hypothetical protein
LDEVLIAGHEEAVVLASEVPDPGVRGSRVTQGSNVERARKQVSKGGNECFGEVFVEEEPHRLRRGNGQKPTLTLGSEGQAGEDVGMSELRKVDEQLGLGGAASEVSEDVPNGEPGAPDARLPEADGGVDGDAFKLVHGNKIGRGSEKSKRALEEAG